MTVLKVLRAQPTLFFRLSGIREADFDTLFSTLHPIWLDREEKRLSRKDRQRAIGGGMSYRLEFVEQLLLCLIYYRTYTSYASMGLLFNVSSPTVCRRVRAMTAWMAGHFRMPERRVKLSKAEKDDLLYLMIDGTERPVQRPVQRPRKPSKRKTKYSGKKKHHTASHQIITDNKKRIWAVGPAHHGRKHDKRIYDETRVDKPPDVLNPWRFRMPWDNTGNSPEIIEEKTTYERTKRLQHMACKAVRWRRARYLSHEKVQNICGYSPQQPAEKQDRQECWSARQSKFENSLMKWGRVNCDQVLPVLL